MPTKRIAIFKHGCCRQRGGALMILLVIIVAGLATTLISSLSITALENARKKTNFDVMAQAKDALIGRAVNDSSIPGSLPCPDTNNDGSAELLSGNNCPSYIGRLPWITLGLPDLRDASGERLWYALSPAFRDDNSASPLNSNTKGTLVVYNADGVSLQTQAGYNAVAVIFSPGSPIGSQTRGTVAQQNNAANYLDIANSWNNSVASGPFIAGAKSATFNDQLLIITTQSLMPPVEQRVASEVKRALKNYYNTNGYYPWADSVAQSADYNSNYGLNRGWLPDVATASGSYYSTPNWPLGNPAPWFMNNQWYTLIYYSVAENYTVHPADCTSCVDTTLSVDGVNLVRYLFFMPGTPIGTLARSVTDTTLSDYLEDSENNDDANDLYVTPTSKALDRDRLYHLP